MSIGIEEAAPSNAYTAHGGGVAPVVYAPLILHSLPPSQALSPCAAGFNYTNFR